MSELLTVGIQISFIGLTVTFVALGVLVGVIWVLRRLFPPTAVSPAPRPEPDAIPDDGGDEAEIAVVIATALALAREQQKNQLGARLEEERGAWWHRQTENIDAQHGRIHDDIHTSI